MTHHSLGIDVAKDKLDVALSDGHQIIEQAIFSNDRTGFKKLNPVLSFCKTTSGRVPRCS